MREKPGLLSSRKLLLLSLLVPLLIAGAFQLLRAEKYLFFKGDSTFPEGAVVQTALWGSESGRVYPNLEESPYTPAPYGPLFYVSLSALAKMAGPDFDHVLVAGRIVVFCAFLGLLALTYLWGKRQTLPLAITLICPAMILSQIDFEAWNASVRPDLPALLVCFLAFFVLTRVPVSWRAALLAGCLCSIAGLLKQSFIALPLAALIWLMMTRQKKAALWFLVGLGGVAIAVFLPLSLRHEPFLREMLLARYSPISPAEAVKMVKTDFLNYPGQIVFFAMGVLGLLRMGSLTKIPRSLLATYFFLSWLTNFYTAMAPGANMNAFLEAWLITSVCAPFAFADLAESWPDIGVTARNVVVVLWLTIMAVDLNWWRIVTTSPLSTEAARLAQAVHGKHVLSDAPYVSAHGVKPELLDPSVNHYLEIAKQWSPRPLLQELQNQSFDYVIVGLSGKKARQWRGLTIFSTSILQEIENDYQNLCVTDRFAVYVRRSRTPLDKSEEEFKKATGCSAPLAPDQKIELVPVPLQH